MTMTELYKPFTAMPKPSPESFLIGGLCVSAGGALGLCEGGLTL